MSMEIPRSKPTPIDLGDIGATTLPAAGWKRHFWALVVTWTVVAGGFLAWELHDQKVENEAFIRHTARLVCQKNILIRRWAAGHGGVYVPVTKETPSNPSLAGVKDRDIVTPSGRRLTLMSHATITRQLRELELPEDSVLVHLASLKPLRPADAADQWEVAALHRFERGETEVSEMIITGAGAHMRLMQCMKVEPGCLRCHGQQGYRVGDVRGGVSVTVPMAAMFLPTNANSIRLPATTGVLWLAGVVAIWLLARRTGQQFRAREELIDRLTQAMAEIGSITGLLPIFAWCKRIRDDREGWIQVETYVSKHTSAEFTHGICPDCEMKVRAELKI